MLKVAFILALRLHISPADLDNMDYAEVKYLHDELARFLSGKLGG